MEQAWEEREWVWEWEWEKEKKEKEKENFEFARQEGLVTLYVVCMNRGKSLQIPCTKKMQFKYVRSDVADVLDVRSGRVILLSRSCGKIGNNKKVEEVMARENSTLPPSSSETNEIYIYAFISHENKDPLPFSVTKFDRLHISFDTMAQTDEAELVRQHVDVAQSFVLCLDAMVIGLDCFSIALLSILAFHQSLVRSLTDAKIRYQSIQSELKSLREVFGTFSNTLSDLKTTPLHRLFADSHVTHLIHLFKEGELESYHDAMETRFRAFQTKSTEWETNADALLSRLAALTSPGEIIIDKREKLGSLLEMAMSQFQFSQTCSSLDMTKFYYASQLLSNLQQSIMSETSEGQVKEVLASFQVIVLKYFADVYSLGSDVREHQQQLNNLVYVFSILQSALSLQQTACRLHALHDACVVEAHRRVKWRVFVQAILKTSEGGLECLRRVGEEVRQENIRRDFFLNGAYWGHIEMLEDNGVF